MATIERTLITVEATVNSPVEKVWEFWTKPEHIVHWNFASEEWHSPTAENDLRVGGRFVYRMEAKDGSFGFDFDGIYEEVETNRRIVYRLGDDRRVEITFSGSGSETKVSEVFEADNSHSAEMQKTGWQAILDNFKKYVESSATSETLHFEILIDADREKVYRLMLADSTYREWTAEFNPGSYFEGTWEKGSKILFLGCDNDGKIGGMVSNIKENVPAEFVSIEHLGIVQEGKEITSGPEVDGWAGAKENYTFKDEGGKTLLLVDMDGNEEFKSYFMETWPKALNKLKAICET